MNVNYKSQKIYQFPAVEETEHFSKSRTKPVHNLQTWLTLIMLLVLALFAPMNAQVNLYSFTQEDGAYAEIGGTVVATSTGTTSFDSQNWVLPTGTIPFPFTFNNIDYTGFVINSNGYITFGSTPPSASTSTPISATTAFAGAVSAWGGDLCGVYIADVVTGDVQYVVEGTAPNREFVIQFKNWRPAYSSSTTAVATINFQIRLVETSNEINIVYGPAEILVGAPTTAGTRQIGLRGATNADFNNRTNTATQAFTESVAGTANGNTQAFSYVEGSAQGRPYPGLKYSWTPPPPPPVDLAVTNITGIPVSNCATVNATVAVTIKNKGAESLDFSTDNATVTVAVTGASTQTLTAVVTSGTLAPGAELSVIVDPANFSAAGAHNLSASVAIEDDGIALNNTFATAKTIAAAAVTSPYAESFATATSPAGWNTTGWSFAATHGITSNGIYKNLYGSAATGQFSTLPVGPIVATNELKFDYRVLNYSSTYPGTQIPPTGDWGSLQVQVSTDCGVTFTTIHTINSANHTVADQSWTSLVLPLEDYEGTSIVTRVLMTRVTGDWFIDIDNFKIETPPTCLAPDLLVFDVTSAHTATISWAAPSEVPAGGYEYVFNTINTFPAVAPTAVETTSAELGALTSNTTYYVWVRSICEAGNESTWVPMLPFTTLCDPTNLPYVMAINAATVPALPACVQVQNVNADNRTWVTVASATGMTGKAMRYTYHGTNAADDWFYTQALNLSAGVSYRVKFKYANLNYVEKLKVAIGDETLNTAMTQVLFDVTTPATTSTESKVIDFTVSSSGVYHIGFQAYSAANMNTLTVGEISVVTTPTETVDFANIQAFVVDGAAVNAMQPCEVVDVYAQAWQDGLTDAPGQGEGLVAWIGYSTVNTDPATWAESVWTLATYNVDSGNNDEFKVTYTGLPAGDKYFASRFSILEGPFSYGATNGMWNADTNPSAILSVSIPEIVIAASAVSFCEVAEEVTLTASSSNPNFTYVWSHELGTTAGVTVTPTETTTYSVTGTDSGTGCTTTASVQIAVNPNPTAVTINFDNAEMCAGAIQQLSVAGGATSATALSGSGTFTSTPGSAAPTGPNPFQNYWGGTKQQWIYKAAELTALGFASGTEVKSIAINMVATNGTTLKDVVVKMQNSATQSFPTTAAWETDMITVRNAADHTPAVGQNVLVFDESFVWDGINNLVVEVNYSNNNTGSGSTNTAKYSATDFVSTLYRRADSTTSATMNSPTGPTGGVVTTFSSRIDITFVISSGLPATWSPITDLYTDAAATIPYVADEEVFVVYTKPTADISYVATVTSGAGCAVSSPAQAFISAPEVPMPELASGGGALTNLIISEYGEGAGGNKKYIELYNGTGANVDLANYRLLRSSNGGGWVATPLVLSGTLANNNAYSIANNSTDVIGADMYTTFLQFNGDDAIGLEWNGGDGAVFTLIDVVGQHDSDPGSGWAVAGSANATVDRILTRKETVCAPNTDWATSAGTDIANSEWIVSLAVYNDTAMTTDLGSHTAACGSAGNNEVTVCEDSTVAQLESVVTGTGIKWYAAQTGGTELLSSATLVAGSYYASQTENGCESLRTEILVLIAPTLTPDFAAIAPFCSGSTAPVLPLTSPNGVTGTWDPAVVSNSANGTYIFTPDAGQCAAGQTLEVIVTPTVVPDFAAIATFCSGSEAPVLETTSPNGVVGTWNPATISNTANGTYVFTPDAGQCATTQTLDITVTQLISSDFAAIPAFCSGSNAPTLATTSPNGVTGTWNPATVSNTENGSYVFTPDAGQCATGQTLEVTVTTTVTPDFAAIPALCQGSSAPLLASTSPNGVAGTWSPIIISTITPGTTNYTFTPGADCSAPIVMAVTVNATPDAPTGNAVQDFNTGDTVADLVVSGTGTVTWYIDAAGQTVADPFTELVTGDNYFASLSVNGCESALFEVTVGINLGVDGHDLAKLSFYPNPVTDMLTIDYVAGIDGIDIFNMVGQNVQSVSSQGTQVKVDMTNLAAGTYIIKVVSGNAVKNIKIVKR